MTDEVTSICEECGASVYREHINSGIARYEAGKLMCAHCVAEYERAHDGAVVGSEDYIAPIAFEDDAEDDVESEEDPTDMSQSRIQVATGSMLGEAGKWDDGRYQR